MCSVVVVLLWMVCYETKKQETKYDDDGDDDGDGWNDAVMIWQSWNDSPLSRRE